MFYTLAGPVALGSRLRRLADTLLGDAQKLYEIYGVALDARWFPVFFMLLEKQSAAVTELAQDVGQSHPAVSQVVKQMIKVGLVESNPCPDDGRVSRVSLSKKGKKVGKALKVQCADVEVAVGELFQEAGVDLWSDIDSIEYGLSSAGLFERVMRVRKRRESKRTEIVAFSPQYKAAFKQLNEAWIRANFTLEDADLKVLDHPQENIIDKGGYIAIALVDGDPVGTCALINMGDGCFELAKMAVDDAARGRGIGLSLGEHVIAMARKLGGGRIFLESNTVLAPAINLYRKLGFKQVKGHASPYQRCNIQMELRLGQKV